MTPNDRTSSSRDLRLPRAISFAARAHRGQLRKDGVTPYAAHVSRVFAILATELDVADEDTLVAALLHDTIEDTTVDRDDLEEQFGGRVGEFVAALSKDTRLPELERENRYFEQLADAPVEAKLCKIADTIDNLRDADSLSTSSRRRVIAAAERVRETFAGTLPAEWSCALAKLNEEIAAVRSSATVQ